MHKHHTAHSVWYRFFPALLAVIMLVQFCPALELPVATAATTDIYVGYPSKSNNYATVREAVAACAKINPSSESSRITVHIAPGTYREQVTITTPYITFINDEPQNGEVKLTWYYGIGYKYYSVGSDGCYNAESAAAKSTKNEPTTRWGCSVHLKSGATAFRAENITFEASFNRYVCEEEIADGVEVSGSQSITFTRTLGADVTSKASTERAAAIAIEANQSEFFNCVFLGSQDTVYTGASKGYFKNCRIEGNTDYIFGSGDYVFENTELRFFGYSSSAAGGYITAAREQTMGYLFNNCSITGNSDNVVNAGYFGRPWRDTAVVTFLNTKLESASYMNAAGWASMSGVTPDKASFHEYNTTLMSGTNADTSGRISGTVMSASEAASISCTDYFGDWTPYYYNYEGGTSSAVTKIAYILNADDVATGTYSSDIYVNDGFTICVNAADAVTVDNGSKTTKDGAYTITNRIKLGGAGNTENRSIQVTAKGAGTLKVYMMSSNSSAARTAQLLDSTGAQLATVENVGGTELAAFTFTIPSAGIYYLSSTASGINVYYAILYQNGEDQIVPATGTVMDTSKTYTIRNLNSGYYLGVENGTAAAGSNVNQQAFDAKNAAQLTWTLCNGGDGYYYIFSSLGDGATYLLDLDYGNTGNGTNIGIYTDTQSDAQLFKFVQNDDGSFCITTKATVDCSGIGVASASKEVGANVIQWELNGSTDQSWILEEYIPAPTYSAADAAALKRALLRIDPVAEEDDINADGIVNIFDLHALNQILLG